jgi:predicted TIM-barrel fold metal-dependent hydrolase
VTTARITDSQIHLWDADGVDGRAWADGTKPDIDPPLTAARFLAMMDAAGVSRAVISPPAVHGYDPGHALACADAHPERFAVVHRWTLDDPESWDRLPALLDRPGMIGIRIALTADTVARWSADGRLDRFFDEAERNRIPLMLFTTGDLSAVERAATRNPAARLVVDHANLVGSTAETVGERIGGLAALARFPNIAVKLGALPIRSIGAYPYADLHAPLRQLYDAFGAQRLMWASDHSTTLARDKGSYQENLDLIRLAAFGDLRDEEMRWILDRTLSEWFDWP